MAVLLSAISASSLCVLCVEFRFHAEDAEVFAENAGEEKEAAPKL